MDFQQEMAEQEDLRRALSLSPEDFEALVTSQMNSYESITGRSANPGPAPHLLTSGTKKSKHDHTRVKRKLWDSLPREDRDDVLEKIARVSVPLSADNMMRILEECVIPHLGISPAFTTELLQNVYRCNAVQLQPTQRPICVIDGSDHSVQEPRSESIIQLFLPPRTWRSEIKVIEFFPCDTSIGNVSYSTGSDIWQELKNVCFPSQYHFHNLNRVDVFFEAEVVRMQSFWNWEVHIDIGSRVIVIDVCRDGWESKMKSAVEARRAQQLLRKGPGFKLFKRIHSTTHKTAAPSDDDIAESIAGEDEGHEDWESGSV